MYYYTIIIKEFIYCKKNGIHKKIKLVSNNLNKTEILTKITLKPFLRSSL